MNVYQNGAEHAIAFHGVQGLLYKYLRFCQIALKLAKIADIIATLYRHNGDYVIRPQNKKTNNMNKKEKQEKKQGQLNQALRENLKRRKQQSSVPPAPKPRNAPPETDKKD